LIYTFFETIHSLTQICLHPKLEAFRQIYNNIGGKIVVFSSYKKFFIETMSPWLDKLEIKHTLFCGGSKQKQKNALKQFNTNDKIKILLVVKRAGAIGLNLQAASSTVVIFEPYFNSALDSQATHRVDRIDQKNNIIIKRLIMEGSVDVALQKMQHEKDKLIKSWTRPNGTDMTFEITSMHMKKYDTV